MPIPERVFGLPTWGVVGALGAAAVVGYFIFFRNSGSGSGSMSTIVQGFGDNTTPDYSASVGQLENQLLSNQETLKREIEGAQAVNMAEFAYQANPNATGQGSYDWWMNIANQLWGTPYHDLLATGDLTDPNGQTTSSTGTTLNTIGGQDNFYQPILNPAGEGLSPVGSGAQQ